MNTPRRYVDPALETMPVEDFRGLQLRLLRDLVTDVYASNPFYRSQWQKAGVAPQHLTSLQAFTELWPSVDKATFLDDQLSEPPFGRRFDPSRDSVGQIHTTSGTSGLAKEVHVVGRHEIEAMGSGYHFLLKWAGIEPGMRALLTLKLSTLAGGQTFTQGVMSYPLVNLFAADKSSEEKIELLDAFDVDLLQAFSGYLQRLRSILEARGLNPRQHLPHLKAILTGLQAYDVAWMEDMEAFWGVHIAEHYGSTQTTLHMATCEAGPTPAGRRGMLHNLGHLVFIEVVDPLSGEHVAAGEEGELVVTTLFRRMTPVVRFRLGDKARYLPAQACSCGRPFDGVEAGTISRYDDMLKIKGVNFWPSSAEGFILNSPSVANYVAEISFTPSGAEVVKIRLEQKEGVPSLALDDEATAIRRAFKERIGFDVSIEWSATGTLPTFEYKVRRWHDNRHLARQATS